MSRRKVRILVSPRGELRALHDDAFPLPWAVRSAKRAAHVELKGYLVWWRFRQRWRLRYIPRGSWYVDLAPSRGPILGPFATRALAVESERAWLERHWLRPS